MRKNNKISDGNRLLRQIWDLPEGWTLRGAQTCLLGGQTLLNSGMGCESMYLYTVQQLKDYPSPKGGTCMGAAAVQRST